MKLFFHFLFIKGAGKKTFFITTAKEEAEKKSKAVR